MTFFVGEGGDALGQAARVEGAAVDGDLDAVGGEGVEGGRQAGQGGWLEAWVLAGRVGGGVGCEVDFWGAG